MNMGTLGWLRQQRPLSPTDRDSCPEILSRGTDSALLQHTMVNIFVPFQICNHHQHQLRTVRGEGWRWRMNMRNDRAGLQGSARVLGRSTISIYVSKFITVL